MSHRPNYLTETDAELLRGMLEERTALSADEQALLHRLLDRNEAAGDAQGAGSFVLEALHDLWIQGGWGTDQRNKLLAESAREAYLHLREGLQLAKAGIHR